MSKTTQRAHCHDLLARGNTTPMQMPKRLDSDTRWEVEMVSSASFSRLLTCVQFCALRVPMRRRVHGKHDREFQTAPTVSRGKGDGSERAL
jgi:hypothetical protein